MKYPVTIIIALFLCNIAVAQKPVMMGKVLNASGKPVAGAELKITGRNTYYIVKTDNDGIYNTPHIAPGPYRVIIDADGKYFSAERVKLPTHCAGPEFYNFVLTGDHVELQTDHGKDPAMVARLEQLEK